MSAPTNAGPSSTEALKPEVAVEPRASLSAPSETVDPQTSQVKQLGKATLIYGLGMVLSRAASLIMLPVYTRMLTPDDYGLLQMLDMTVDIVSIIVSVGCTMGLMRFYFKAPGEQERREVVVTAVLLQLGLNLIGTIALAASAGPVWRQLLHGQGSTALVYLAAANFSIGSLATVPLLVMQMRQLPSLYTLTTVGRLVLQLTLNIVFLVGLRMGPLGILLSSCITGAIVGGLSLAWLLRSNGFHFSRAALSDLWRFGVPYQFVTAGTFVLNFGDRFFLSKSWGLAAVGVYSLAYQFGFLVEQIGYAPFARAWNPMRFQQVNEPREVRDRKYSEGFLYLNLLMLTTVVGMGVLVRPVLRVMSSPEFLVAADIVPVVLAAFVMQTWMGVLQFGIDVSERTKYSTYATWTSVVVIVALYATLIPPYGAMGAAVATFIAFTVRTILFYVFAQRLWPVSYGWGPVMRLGALTLVTVGAKLVVRPEKIVLEFATSALLLGVYALAVWSVVLGTTQRQALRDFIAARFGRLTSLVARA